MFDNYIYVYPGLPLESYIRLSYPINALFLHGKCKDFPIISGHAAAGRNTDLYIDR